MKKREPYCNVLETCRRSAARRKLIKLANPLSMSIHQPLNRPSNRSSIHNIRKSQNGRNIQNMRNIQNKQNIQSPHNI